MLQNLREHVQGWIAAVIAGVLCLAFALWGVEYYIGGSPSQSVVAKVDGFEITKNQWDAAYNRARQSQQIQISDPKLNETYQNQIKARALNGLIQERVLGQAAQKAGYVISPAQVGALLQQMPAFQLGGRFSYPLFQRTLENLSYTPEGFTHEIAKSSLLTQVQRSLVESNFVLPQDLDRNSVLQNQKRNFGYAVISPTAFLAQVSVKGQEIEDYYKAHGKDFTLPEQVSLQYVMLSTEEANKKIKVTSEELTQYYEENKAAFGASKNAKAVPSFASVKPAVEKALRQQKVEQWVANQSDELANLTYTHPDTLKPAADALGLPIQTTGFFTQQGEKKGFLSNPKILAAAFSDNVLGQRNNSDVIPIDDRTAVVIRIAENKPAVPQPLAKVRGEIEKYLKQQAAQKAAMALGEKVQQAMQKGASPQQLATQYKLNWVQKSGIGRSAKDVPPQVLNLVFNQPAPESSKKPVIQGKSLPDGNYAVVAITAVMPGNLTSVNAAQRKAMQKQMESDFGALDYDLYLAQQIGAAKIKMEAEAK